MNKTEILNIVNEPTKHIQLVKIDGKDSIVYSSKFVELLELIPTMLTKADMVAILDKIRAEIEQEYKIECEHPYGQGLRRSIEILDKCKTESEENMSLHITDKEVQKQIKQLGYKGCKNCQHQIAPLRMCEWAERGGDGHVHFICPMWDKVRNRE